MFPFVLFDLDGTLTDPYEGITKSVQYALEDYGMHVSDRTALRCFIGPPLLEQFMEFAGMCREEAEHAVEKYRERFAVQGLFENKVYDGIPKLLAVLRNAGCQLAVATSKPQVFANRILEHFNLHPNFTAVVGSELDGRRTNKAEVIQAALEALHITPNDGAVMVGDRQHDVLGAQKCGIPSIGVSYGYAEPGELARAGATYIAENLATLQRILLQGNELR